MRVSVADTSNHILTNYFKIGPGPAQRQAGCGWKGLSVNTGRLCGLLACCHCCKPRTPELDLGVIRTRISELSGPPPVSPQAQGTSEMPPSDPKRIPSVRERGWHHHPTSVSPTHTPPPTHTRTHRTVLPGNKGKRAGRGRVWRRGKEASQIDEERN